MKGHRVRRGRVEYLVSWVGYDASEDMFLPESELGNCLELLLAYRRYAGLC